MVRWRFCLVLAMLLLLPTRIGSKLDDEEDDDSKSSDRRNDDGDDDDDEDDDEEEDADAEKTEQHSAGRRAPAAVHVPTPKALTITRTTKKRPLECYVCAYKAETPLRACLDPTKFRVHTITCHNSEDKCFTSVISKGNSYEAVVRGCRSGCVGTPETTCCELNRCNNQAFAMPLPPPRALTANKSGKTIPPTIFVFVTILLVLQTVVKVSFV